jgi:hypothetical protein
VALFALVASVSCGPVHDSSVAENIVGAGSECVDNDTSLCLKVNTMDLQVLSEVLWNLLRLEAPGLCYTFLDS